MAKRDFTGVFIPAHIWTSKDLTPAEKMMCGEIDALSKRDGWCDASRAHFAEWLQCTEQNISGYWKKLERIGFIEIEKTPGKRSRIRLNQQRFWVDTPVSPTYPTRQSHLRVPVSPTYPTRQSHLPEIKEEIQIEIKEKRARAQKDETLLVEEEKKAPPIPAAPPATPVSATLRAVQWCLSNPDDLQTWIELARYRAAKDAHGLEPEILSFFSYYMRETGVLHKVNTDPIKFFTNGFPKWLRDAAVRNAKDQKPAQATTTGIKFFTADNPAY